MRLTPAELGEYPPAAAALAVGSAGLIAALVTRLNSAMLGLSHISGWQVVMPCQIPDRTSKTQPPIVYRLTTTSMGFPACLGRDANAAAQIVQRANSMGPGERLEDRANAFCW